MFPFLALKKKTYWNVAMRIILEGSDSVIVKGRLRVNQVLGKALASPSLFSALSEKVLRSLFTTLLHRFIYRIIIPP